MNKIIDFKAIAESANVSAILDGMAEKRRQMIESIRSEEEQALRRAICRFFGIDNPFDAVGKVSAIVSYRGNRRYECIETGRLIIQFHSIKFRRDDDECKIFASMDYKTFDGIK